MKSPGQRAKPEFILVVLRHAQVLGDQFEPFGAEIGPNRSGIVRFRELCRCIAVTFHMTGIRIIAEAWVSDLLPLMLVAGLGCLFTRRPQMKYLGWLIAYIVIDDVIGLTPIILHWNFGRWNWIGQTASALFALLIAKQLFTNDEVALRMPRSRREIIWTVVGVAGALTIAVGGAIFGPGTHPDLETFAYQGTLPGLVEELSVRGVGLALLLRTFRTEEVDRRGEWIAVLVNAVWFTSGHVFHLENGKFLMVWARVLDVFPMAVWYCVIRLRSRSLLGGVLAHNGANLLVESIAAIRF